MKVTASHEVLQRLLEMSEVLTPEIHIVSHPDRITIDATDPAHVAMIHADCPASVFEEYVPGTDTDGTPLRISIPIPPIKDVLAITKDVCTLEWGPGGFTVSSGRVRRRIPVYFNEKPLKVPAFQGDFQTIEVDTREVLPMLARAKNIRDYVRLILTPEGLTYTCNSDNGHELEYTDPTNRSMEGNPVKVAVPLDYLSRILKSMGPQTVTMDLLSDFPVIIKCPGDWTVEFYLAPRIEQEA